MAWSSWGTSWGLPEGQGNSYTIFGDGLTAMVTESIEMGASMIRDMEVDLSLFQISIEIAVEPTYAVSVRTPSRAI